MNITNPQLLILGHSVVYQVTNLTTGATYIGFKAKAEEMPGYFTSSSDLAFVEDLKQNPDRYHCCVLAVFRDPADARAFEAKKIQELAQTSARPVNKAYYDEAKSRIVSLPGSKSMVNRPLGRKVKSSKVIQPRAMAPEPSLDEWLEHLKPGKVAYSATQIAAKVLNLSTEEITKSICVNVGKALYRLGFKSKQCSINGIKGRYFFLESL